MEKIAWLIDSASDIRPEIIDHEDVFVIPLHVNIDGESYRDGVDITPAELYRRMDTAKEIKSSQPSTGEFVEMYEKLQQKYDRCIAILVSGNVSGTFNAARLAADMVDIKVDLVDSKYASIPMLFILEEGLRLQQEGKSPEEIVTILRDMPSRIKAYVLIKDLERLHKGGRLNAAQFIMGNLLQVKPIIYFLDGTVATFEKVRGFNKAKSKIAELFANDVDDKEEMTAYIVHSDESEGTQWKEELSQKFPHVTFKLAGLGPTIGVHAGKGTVALTWVKPS